MITRTIKSFLVWSACLLGTSAAAQTITMSAAGPKNDMFCSADGGQPDQIASYLNSPPAGSWRWGVTGAGLSGTVGTSATVTVSTIYGTVTVQPMVSPNNPLYANASMNEGDHILVAYPVNSSGQHTGGPAYASKLFTVVPSGSQSGSVSSPGINGITTSGSFTISGNQWLPSGFSFNSPYHFSSQGLYGVVNNGVPVLDQEGREYLRCSGTYIIGNTNGQTLSVTPKLWTPLNEKIVTRGFFKNSNCLENYAISAQADRKPHIGYSGGPGNVVCSGGSGVLEVNVESEGRFTMNPERPYDNVQSNHCLRGFLYRWFKDGNDVGHPFRQYTPSQPGTYTCQVIQYKQKWNGGAWQWDQTPEATETSNAITLVAPATSISADFLVNNIAVNNTGFTFFYRCTGTEPLVLTNTSTGAAYKYSLTVNWCTSTGQHGGTIYSSGLVTGTPPASVNLRDIDATIPGNSPSGNPDYLDQYGGYFKIIWTVDNGCGLQSTKEAFISVLQPTANVDLQTNTSCSTCTPSAIQYFPSSNSAISPDRVGRYSTVFLFNNGQTNNSPTCNYSYQLERYNSGSWTAVGQTVSLSTGWNCITPVSHTIPISVAAGNTSTFINYFSSTSNAPDGSIWRLRVDMTNPCGTNSKYAVFEIEDQNGYYRTAPEVTAGLTTSANAVEADVRFAPVPFGDGVSATIYAPTGGRCNLQVLSADGRLVYSLSERSVEAGQTVLPIQTGSWAPGLYFYRGSVGGQPVSGKISKH